MLPQSIIQKFRESLRGQSFCPEESGYDDARTIPNAMINRRPAIIARCASAADVISFSQDELRKIFNLYGRKVGDG